MRKVTSDTFLAEDKVKHFIASYQAFTFMNGIKGTPAYCKSSYFTF